MNEIMGDGPEEENRKGAMERYRLHKLRNLAHSAVLIAGMAGIAGTCAWILWGWNGVLWALAGLVAGLAFAPTVPPQFVLSLYGARRLGAADFPEGHAVLAELCRRAGIGEPPALYYVPSPTLNAFTVGRPPATAVAITDGMLRTLGPREFAGVLAHEISHIAGNDLWIMNLADAMSRASTLLSYFGIFLLILNLPLVMAGALPVPWLLVLLLIAAPTLMNLCQLALSRAREYDADLEAARLTGDPEGLASALAKLERRDGRLWESVLVPGGRVPDPSLLRTHPPTEERIRRLLELRPRKPQPPLSMPTATSLAPRHIPIVQRGPRWRGWGLWY